jgi:GNAT superfamily N-acetyltransferase
MAEEGSEVFIASAFFTESEVVERYAAQKCTVRIVVRLGYPTSPNALARLLRFKGIQARYYPSHRFHPKLYIFGQKCALVGSANLTKAALFSNQEVVVSVDGSDERFNDLQATFSMYWRDAETLTEEAIEKYRLIYNAHKAIAVKEDEMAQAVEQAFGNAAPSTIELVGQPRRTDEDLFLSSYRRIYQECTHAFSKVREVYEVVGRRKFDEATIPLRIEIDSFISFIRDRYTTADSWQDTELGFTDARRSELSRMVEEWLRTPWVHFENTIVFHNYPAMMKAFASPETIRACDDDQLFGALCTAHAFHDRLRFYKDGIPGLRTAFFEENQDLPIRERLSYLMFGRGDPVSRMSRLIHDPAFKLNGLGRACVQELIGWKNAEELPIINGRTTRVLRFLGFDVAQCR